MGGGTISVAFFTNLMGGTSISEYRDETVDLRRAEMEQMLLERRNERAVAFNDSYGYILPMAEVCQELMAFRAHEKSKRARTS